MGLLGTHLHRDRNVMGDAAKISPRVPSTCVQNAILSLLIIRDCKAMGESTYGRQFYDLIWSLALVNASIEHGLKVAGSCPLAR